MSARPLDPAEIALLSPGLWQALEDAGARPKISRQTHPAAYVVAIWRKRPPIMAVGQTIWWPNAPPSLAGTMAMSVLQHELQHLLEFAEGRLSIWSYLLNPFNWIYRYELSRLRGWDDFGAEQRASMAEDLWTADLEGDLIRAGRLRALIPWAHEAARPPGAPA